MSDTLFFSALEQVIKGPVSLPLIIEKADALAKAGRLDRAGDLYEVWLKFNVDHPHAYAIHFNLSVVLGRAQNLERAEHHLRKAIEANPAFMPPYVNLGGLLERKGAAGDGLVIWRSGVEQLAGCTGDAVVHKTTLLKQIARVLLDHQKGQVAEGVLADCLDVDPCQRDAIGQYVPIRLSQCEWPIINPTGRLDRSTMMRAVQPLTIASYTDDPLLQLASAWAYMKKDIDEASVTAASDRRQAPIDLSQRRLRIGYVSSDLRDHAIGYLLAELFEVHDKGKVEVFAYYCGPSSESALTERIKAAVEHWVDIRGVSDDDAAALIASQGVDILVDVNGLTKDARTAVFARRPAPVQVNWLGFPGPMASPYHHYIIADDWIIPPENEIYYSETVVRLPCYQANDRKRGVASTRPTRAEAGLPEGAFVFCCFNGSQKITRFTYDRWIEILLRTPGSVLWLLESSQGSQDRLVAYAKSAGIDGGRIIFAPKQANAHHLARYPLADLFLDTAPYGAHTTASDALWMGVPVLTLSGRGFAARVCGSLVRAAGLPELICSDPRAYVETAVALVYDRPRLQSLRRRLEQGRSHCVLFDMDRLARELEAIYQKMAADHGRGLTPRPDLRNLEIYHDVGVETDHDQCELLAEPDYHGLYRARLARRHAIRPIPADDRLWTVQAIAAAEAAWTTAWVSQPAIAPPLHSAAASALNPAPAPAPAPVQALHPLLQLRDVYDAASAMLCQKPPSGLGKAVGALLAESLQIAIEAPAGSVPAGWEKHYRLMFEAIDPALLTEKALVPAPEAALGFLGSNGASLDRDGVKAMADRLGVEAIFFAASDEAHVVRYARRFAVAALERSDVRCLVVVHVVGGKDRLAAIAQSIGLWDERFVLVGDDLPPEAMSPLCYDSPPSGLCAIPVAKLQGARFMRLGGLLDLLKRPMFVCDIDVLLQHGPLDMLNRFKGYDVVFNQNEEGANAGSYLIGTLVLINPTSGGAVFANFLRAYFNNVLMRPEVTRWIHQFALLMGRTYTMRKSKKLKIGGFDKTIDINPSRDPDIDQDRFHFLSLEDAAEIVGDRDLQASYQTRVAAA